MESNKMITTAVALSIAGLLFFVVKWSNLKKKNKNLNTLVDFAGENGCKISEHNYCRGTRIGIDKANKSLFFIRTIKDVEERLAIDLNEVSKCYVNIASRTSGEGNNKQSVIDKIELIFVYNEKARPDASLEFYNSEYDMYVITEEFHLSEKWAGIANSIIKN